MKINCQQKNKGIALIIVMLVILVLSTLAAGFAYSMKVELRLAAQSNYDSQLDWIGRSGVEYARFFITEQDKLPGPKVHCLNQAWAGGISPDTNSIFAGMPLKDVPLGDGTFSIEITDNERKFNINTVGQNPLLLQQALLVMGVDAGDSPTISDSILDWIDPDNDTHQSGAENEYYLGLDLAPYYCKNGLIDDMSELLLVKGIRDHQEIYYGSSSTNVSVSRYQARDGGGSGPLSRDNQPSYTCGLVDLFTTLSSGKININTAPMNTLRMAFGGDQNIAQEVLRLRAGPDGQDGTEDDIPFQNPGEVARNLPGASQMDATRLAAVCDVRSYTFQVVVDAEIKGYKRQYVAVLRRTNNNAFSILYFYGK